MPDQRQAVDDGDPVLVGSRAGKGLQIKEDVFAGFFVVQHIFRREFRDAGPERHFRRRFTLSQPGEQDLQALRFSGEKHLSRKPFLQVSGLASAALRGLQKAVHLILRAVEMFAEIIQDHRVRPAFPEHPCRQLQKQGILREQFFQDHPAAELLQAVRAAVPDHVLFHQFPGPGVLLPVHQDLQELCPLLRPEPVRREVLIDCLLQSPGLGILSQLVQSQGRDQQAASAASAKL